MLNIIAQLIYANPIKPDFDPPSKEPRYKALTFRHWRVGEGQEGMSMMLAGREAGKSRPLPPLTSLLILRSKTTDYSGENLDAGRDARTAGGDPPQGWAETWCPLQRSVAGSPVSGMAAPPSSSPALQAACSTSRCEQYTVHRRVH